MAGTLLREKRRAYHLRGSIPLQHSSWGYPVGFLVGSVLVYSVLSGVFLIHEALWVKKVYILARCSVIPR